MGGTKVIDTGDNQLVTFNKEYQNHVLPLTIFFTVEMCIGFFGNLVVLYVFSCRYHRCNFRYFILCLAVTDLTSTLTSIPGEIYTQRNWYMYPFKEICKIKSYFTMFTVSCQVLCLLTVSIDRFLKVCRPFGRQIKPRAAVFSCVAIYVVSCLLATPVPYFWELQTREMHYKNATINVTICERKNKTSGLELHPFAWIYFVAFPSLLAIILIVMFVLYVLIVRKLFQDRRKTLSKLNRKVKVYGGTPSSLVSNGTRGCEHLDATKCVQKCEESNRSLKESNGELLSKQNDSKVKLFEDNRLVTQSSRKTVSICLETEIDLKTVEEQNDDGDESSEALTSDMDVIHSGENSSLDSDKEPETDLNRELGTDIERRNINMVNSKALLRPKSTRSSARRRTLNRNRISRNFQKSLEWKVRRKTKIMFILTIGFIIPIGVYLALMAFDTVTENADGQNVVYRFFLRLYFINNVIHPFVYGFLDPRFKQVVLGSVLYRKIAELRHRDSSMR